MSKILNKKKILLTLNKRLVELDEIASEDQKILSRFENQFRNLSILVEEASHRLCNKKPIASALKSKLNESYSISQTKKKLKRNNRKDFEKQIKDNQPFKRRFKKNMKLLERMHSQQLDVKVKWDEDESGIILLKEKRIYEDDDTVKEESKDRGTIRERVNKMIRFCK